MPLARMRTLDQCYDELKRLDPGTNISKYRLRQLALKREIPIFNSGRRRLLNLDALISFINESGSVESEPAETGVVRRVG